MDPVKRSNGRLPTEVTSSGPAGSPPAREPLPDGHLSNSRIARGGQRAPRASLPAGGPPAHKLKHLSEYASNPADFARCRAYFLGSQELEWPAGGKEQFLLDTVKSLSREQGNMSVVAAKTSIVYVEDMLMARRVTPTALRKEAVGTFFHLCFNAIKARKHRIDEPGDQPFKDLNGCTQGLVESSHLLLFQHGLHHDTEVLQRMVNDCVGPRSPNRFDGVRSVLTIMKNMLGHDRAKELSSAELDGFAATFADVTKQYSSMLLAWREAFPGQEVRVWISPQEVWPLGDQVVEKILLLHKTALAREALKADGATAAAGPSGV